MNAKTLSLESMISQIDDIVASNIDNEIVMMSIKKGQYFGLEPIGSRIWELIEHQIKVTAIIDTLVQQYDVSRETCQRDVMAFLEELYQAGIIQVEDK